MQEAKMEIKFRVYDSIAELSEENRALVARAQQVRKDAYAPYSEFLVGSAVLLENGEIVVGSNQENAAYPSGLCAERVAIYYASAIYPQVKVKKVVIVGGSTKKITSQPVAPCGACRQAMFEYQDKQGSEIEILFMGEEGKIVHANSLKDLLPFSFDQSFV